MMGRPPGKSLEKPIHGTTKGFAWHQRQGTDPCELCRKAKAEYDANWRIADDNTRVSRLRALARSAALSRLSKMHPRIYRALYREECERVFTEHGMPIPIWPANERL